MAHASKKYGVFTFFLQRFQIKHIFSNQIKIIWWNNNKIISFQMVITLIIGNRLAKPNYLNEKDKMNTPYI